jgi:hypothetical protein
LEQNGLHDIPEKIITTYGSKLQLNYNCFSSRDSSTAAINYMTTRYGNPWESYQRICIKDITYDPADPGNGTTLSGPVTATLSFYGPANREAEFTGNYPNEASYTFYDNIEYTFNFTNYPYRDYIVGQKTYPASVTWMDGPITGGELTWTRTTNGGNPYTYIHTQYPTSLYIDR